MSTRLGALLFIAIVAIIFGWTYWSIVPSANPVGAAILVFLSGWSFWFLAGKGHLDGIKQWLKENKWRAAQILVGSVFVVAAPVAFGLWKDLLTHPIYHPRTISFLLVQWIIVLAWFSLVFVVFTWIRDAVRRWLRQSG